MRKSILLTLLILFQALIAFSQPIPTSKDSSATNQKFYFPRAYYSDSIALNNAMPELAKEVAAVYHEDKKKEYLGKAIYYQLLAENYGRAIDMIDSLWKIQNDSTDAIELKSYALAKQNELNEKNSFARVFNKEFSQEFSRLSFRKRVYVALIDSSWLSSNKKEYTTAKEKFRKANDDSLNLDDARSFCDAFAYYTIYNKIYPLMASFIPKEYRGSFPAIKSVSWAAVVPVQDIDEKPDPHIQYKLLFELTGFAYKGQDSTAKAAINDALGSVARELNLHEANGIPKKNIHPVVVVHGTAIDVFLNNEKYKTKYGVDNPNIPLIKELQQYGVKMIACGQLMTYARVEKQDLVPGIMQALTAQTVISSYQLKGYVYYDFSLRE